MNSFPVQKAIVVYFHYESIFFDYKEIKNILGRARTQCIVHRSYLPDVSKSRFSRVFKRGGPYDSQVEAAYRFVVESYQPGDHVMLLGVLWSGGLGDPRFNAILKLATTLDTDTTATTSGSVLVSRRIPIKCLFLYLGSMRRLQWSGFDRVMTLFPSTVENVLCMSEHDAYAVERGPNGQIMRKEAWLSERIIWYAWLDFLVLQTRYFIDYSPSDLVDSKNPSGLVRGIGQPQMLSMMTHWNCTKRRRGIPCPDGLPTGGQLARVSKITWLRANGTTTKSIVWSSQSFVEGGYDDVCNTPLVGPRLM